MYNSNKKFSIKDNTGRNILDLDEVKHLNCSVYRIELKNLLTTKTKYNSNINRFYKVSDYGDRNII
jgi:hypothetical protein